MDVSEAIKRKKELEVVICGLLRNFEQETQCTIVNISIDKFDVTTPADNSRKVIIGGITVNISI